MLEVEATLLFSNETLGEILYPNFHEGVENQMIVA